MPEEVIKPWLDADRAKQLLRTHFGFNAVSVHELESYDDRNFHMQLDPSDPSFESYPDGFTLKVTNWVESQQTDFLESLHALMEHVSDTVPTPRPIRTTSAHIFATEVFPIGNKLSSTRKECAVRLFSFLPGATLCEKEVWPSTCQQWGSLMGRLHVATQGLDFPGIRDRWTQWSLLNVCKIDRHLHTVGLNDEEKKLVEDVLLAVQDVLTSVQRLPSGILHGDLNEQNILVRTGRGDEDTEVYAVLDWGDVQWGPRVLDVAVMLTYVVLAPTASRHCYENVAHAMTGYMQHMDLDCSDPSIFKTLICSRLCQSLVLGRYAKLLNPDNDYVLYSQRRGWKVLRKLWKTPISELVSTWNIVLRENGVKEFLTDSTEAS
ncbi:hydroxylysine kinase-like [Ornithodoros turicata]|uniref:hydroxylysine kinase-like n=1 Tax=Ornithodoros turicata TaxID=34597 RepID=UPI003139D058